MKVLARDIKFWKRPGIGVHESLWEEFVGFLPIALIPADGPHIHKEIGCWRLQYMLRGSREATKEVMGGGGEG